jgi:2'-5' RNA ligase
MFDTNTYAVLDVPEPFARAVMAVRVKHRDEFRSALPVEITVAGSNGVGEFEPDQVGADVFGTLDAIATEAAPIEATFGPVDRFPGTEIFFLTLQDERPFHELHHRIASSPSRFKQCPFPYRPHCTLRDRTPISDEDIADLLAVEIPGSFVLDTLSVYAMPPPMPLLHRVQLGSRRQA